LRLRRLRAVHRPDRPPHEGDRRYERYRRPSFFRDGDPNGCRKLVKQSGTWRSDEAAIPDPTVMRNPTLCSAQFLAATGGDIAVFASTDHLAGYAGLAPAPRDSGRRTGNLHRPATTTVNGLATVSVGLEAMSAQQ
jgi:hypothetical protein